MANAVSRLVNSMSTWSFKYNCYEAVHPWTPHCSDSALDLGLTVFVEALKLYTPLYLVTQVFVKRRLDGPSFKSTAQSILRSTSFISANAFFALLFFCSSQYVTGKFYYYAVAYLPAFLASSMAVLIEKPHRRSSLAFYVANVASEALFRIYVARGYLKPVDNGQVYLFTLAMAALMTLAHKHGFEDDPLSAAIKLVVGPEEAAAHGQQVALAERAPPDAGAALQAEAAAAASSGRLTALHGWLMRLLVARHRLCPHQGIACSRYALWAAARAFAIGYGAQLGLKLATRSAQICSEPRLALRLASDRGLLRFALFLATFSGLFKATNCALRWSLDTWKPPNSFIASLVAGPAMALFPSPTIALYVTWKCLEALFHDAARRNIIQNKNLFIVILYGAATSQLFYSAMLDPRYMKKSYMGFLDRISRHRLHLVNRSVLDVFGTEASSGYEDFFPDLHPGYMSHAFLGSIWIWMIEQKIVAKPFN